MTEGPVARRASGPGAGAAATGKPGADADLGGRHAEPVVVGSRYRLERPIGAGPVGVVWEAVDERLGRLVAVKELRLGQGSPPGTQFKQARQRVMREARLAARLQHPHAIAVLDLVMDDDRPWLVMEYLPSQSLADVLAERGALPARQVAVIGSQIADALAAAHAAGFVHCDIRPGNVLLTSDGTVKITDFGVSHAPDDLVLTRTGVITGTSAYLAPEIARGESPTAASDVFALGATLYTAVEGQPPFGPADNVYASHTIADGAVTPPKSAGPLTAALMHLLREAPDERSTAAEARDRLQVIAEGAAPAARVRMRTPAPNPSVAADQSRAAQLTRLWATQNRQPRLAATLATLVLVLLAGAALTLVALGSASGSTQAARNPGTPARGAAAPALSAPGATTPPSATDEPAPLAIGDPAQTAARLAPASAVTANAAYPRSPGARRGVTAEHKKPKGHRVHGHGPKRKKGAD